MTGTRTSWPSSALQTLLPSVVDLTRCDLCCNNMIDINCSCRRTPTGLAPEIAHFTQHGGGSDFPKQHAGDVGGGDFTIKEQARTVSLRMRGCWRPGQQRALLGPGHPHRQAQGMYSMVHGSASLQKFPCPPLPTVIEMPVRCLRWEVHWYGYRLLGSHRGGYTQGGC